MGFKYWYTDIVIQSMGGKNKSQVRYSKTLSLLDNKNLNTPRPK